MQITKEIILNTLATVSFPGQCLPVVFRMFFSVSLQLAVMFPEGQMLTVKLTIPPWHLKTGENAGIGKPKLGGPGMFPLGD